MNENWQEQLHNAIAARGHQTMVGPELKHICTRDTFQPYALSEEIEVNLIEGDNIQLLYENNQFPNALGYRHNPQRPRLLACLAECDGVIVGVAAASADCDSMWVETYSREQRPF